MSKRKGAYAANTDITPEKTLQDIQKLVRAAGAAKFGYEDSDREIVIRFSMKGLRGLVDICFKVPLPQAADFIYNSIGQRMRDVQAKQSHARAVRSTWRALLLVIKAKLEAIDAGIEVLEEAFLPQIVVENRTVYEALQPALDAYQSGGVRALRAAGGYALLSGDQGVIEGEFDVR